MSSFWRVAIIAALAMVTNGSSWAQDFGKFDASGPPAKSSNRVAQVIYAGLSDVEPEAEQQVDDRTTALEPPANRNHEAPATEEQLADAYLSELWQFDGDVIDGGVGLASMLVPGGGVAGGTDTNNGLAQPSYGVPAPTSEVPRRSGYGVDAAGGLLGGVFDGRCASDGCGGGCGELACGSLCSRQCMSCCGVGTHYTSIYGGLTYLRARNAEVAYAVPVDGPIVAGQAAPIQVGNIGILDPDFEVGFFAGANIALDTVSSLDIRYTMFESLTQDETSAIAPFALRSLTTHPSSATAAQDALSAVGQLEIDFDTIDVAYRHLLKCCDLYSANYVVGSRYAKLEQQFDADYVKNGLETVSTDIDFDGAGLRLGLEAARFSCRNRLHLYAKGNASFLAGRFRAHYFQGQAFDPSVVNAEWEAGRIVPILDLEAGLGWSSLNGKLRLSAGYVVSAWFNTVTTQDYIHAIQTNNFLELSDTTTFDGAQARVEIRF